MTAKNTNRITLKQIDSEINTFVQSKNALQMHGHRVAMMILYHCAPKEVSDDCQGSGDCTRFINLGRAFPTSWAEQLQGWVAHFTPIQLVLRTSGDSVGFSAEYKKLAPKDKPAKWDLEGAASSPFYDFKKERDVEQPKDFEALVALVKNLGKRIKKMADSGKVPDSDILSAEAIASKLDALKFTRVKAKVEEEEAGSSTSKAA